MSQADELAEECARECCAPPPLVAPTKLAGERAGLIGEAFRLELLTIGWMTIEAVVALAAGIGAGSLVLVAFGLDSVIELISAGVLKWRLSTELRHGQAFSEAAERLASRIGGVLLFILATYVVVAAGWNLWDRRGQEFSLAGLVLTILAIPIMDKLCSPALRTDAVESITCGWL